METIAEFSVVIKGDVSENKSIEQKLNFNHAELMDIMVLYTKTQSLMEELQQKIRDHIASEKEKKCKGKHAEVDDDCDNGSQADVGRMKFN